MDQLTSKVNSEETAISSADVEEVTAMNCSLIGTRLACMKENKPFPVELTSRISILKSNR
jgi:hypothetical protein